MAREMVWYTCICNAMSFIGIPEVTARITIELQVLSNYAVFIKYFSSFK